MGDERPGWRRVLEALNTRPSGLLSDVDGTLSAIAPTPEQAYVSDEMKSVLRALAQRAEVVAVITGRAPEQALEMVGIGDLVYVGNHGLEELSGGRLSPAPGVEEYAGRIGEVLRRASERIARDGVIFEDKRVTGSVHYRLARDPERARQELLEVLRPLAESSGLELREGRMIIEIRPPIDVTKGTACRSLIERHGLEGCVFLGDDRTDADAFEVLRELRERKGLRSVGVGVLSPETPAVVRERADLTVEGVEGVLDLLRWLAKRMEANGGERG